MWVYNPKSLYIWRKYVELCYIMLKKCYADSFKHWVHVGMLDIFPYTYGEEVERLNLTTYRVRETKIRHGA